MNRIDRRSDVFGLGAILCHLLTGKPPFLGVDSESARQLAAQGKVQSAFARLDESGSDPELVALCKRCLDPEPDRRPAEAKDVAAAVVALRAAADERAREAEIARVRTGVEVVEQGKRRRLLTVAAAVIVASLVAGAFAWSETRNARLREDAQKKASVRQAGWMHYNEGVAKYVFVEHQSGSRGDARRRAAMIESLNEAIAALEASARELPENPGSEYFVGECLIELGLLTLLEPDPPAPEPRSAERTLAICDRAESVLMPFQAAGKVAAIPGLSDKGLKSPMEIVNAIGAVRMLRVYAFMRLQRSSESLFELDRVAPEWIATTPELSLGGNEPVPTLRALELAVRVMTGTPNIGTEEDFKLIRLILLRNAEQEQSNLPWSRGSKADPAKAV